MDRPLSQIIAADVALPKCCRIILLNSWREWRGVSNASFMMCSGLNNFLEDLTILQLAQYRRCPAPPQPSGTNSSTPLKAVAVRSGKRKCRFARLCRLPANGRSHHSRIV